MVVFIFMFCDRVFSVMYYVFFVLLGNLGRILFLSYSGVVIDDWLDGNWVMFFVLIVFMVILLLVFLFLICYKFYVLENNYYKNN